MMNRRTLWVSALVGMGVTAAAALAGGISPVFTKLAPSGPQPAAIETMNALEAAGPQSIQCSGTTRLLCVAIPDEAVIPTLRRGEVVYGRAIYGDIPMGTTARLPLLAPDELICSARDNGVLECASAATRPPEIGPNTTAMATYKPFNVTFRGDEVIGREATPRTIPVKRRPSG